MYGIGNNRIGWWGLGGGSGGSGVQTIVQGRNILVDATDPENPIVSTTADEITVVANYNALPDPTTVTGDFYWASASQGTRWLPGAVGGTFYNSGMYYSNGVSWEYMETPYQATQAEVNAGVVTDKFVTPNTLMNAVYGSIVLRSTGTDGHRWKFTVGDDGMLSMPGEDLGV